MGAFLHDERTGLYSAGVLSTLLYIFIIGHINILDIPFSFLVSLAAWAGYRYMIGIKPEKCWIYLFYTASALAFLTKGLIGILFPFALLILWLFFSKRRRDIFRLFSPIGLIMMIAIVSPWLVLVQMANKDFLWFFFVHEHLLRYAAKIHCRYQPVLYYLPVVIMGVLPWFAFFIQAIRVNGSNWYKSYFTSTNGRFFIIWITFIFAFFSFSSSKLIPYIAPIFLPIAVIFGHLFKQYDDQTWQPMRNMTDSVLHHLPVVLQSLLFITVLLLPLFVKNYTEFGGDLVIVPSHRWIWLILLPIAFQILLIFLPGITKRRFGSSWFMTTYFLSALFFISLIPPASAFLTPFKSACPLAQAVKVYIPANQQLYQYKMFLYGIESYNDIRTTAVADFGEMTFGMNKLLSAEKSHYFLTEQDFFRLCKKRNGPVYCVTTHNKLSDLRKNGFNFQVIWSNNIYYLMRLT
jgi:4-amino-4-deoxy-L-arabinose transferase-like glycosyltransferase